jgi:hypothetical protein
VHQLSAVPFVFVEPRTRQIRADLRGEPQLWVNLLQRGATIRTLNQGSSAFSSLYFARKLAGAAQPLVLSADSYFWLGATGFVRVAPYLRCMGAVPYLSSLSLILRSCFGLEEVNSGVSDRGSEAGADLINIRYKQRVLMQKLRLTLFTLSGNVPHTLNKRRFVRLATQVGRGYLLQRATFSTRMLLRCSKLVLRREEVAYLLHGGYVFANGSACTSSSQQLVGGGCLQMVVNRSFLLYLLRGWLDLYKVYARMHVGHYTLPRAHRGLSRHLFVFDDVPLGLEVDYTTLTAFCLPSFVPPYEWS